MTLCEGIQSVVSSLVLLSCLSHVSHAHIDVHVGVTIFDHFLMKKHSLQHLLSMMSPFRSL